VADFMVGKLTRLPDATLKVVKDLACLGNTAQTRTIAMALGFSTDDSHSALRDAVSAGLVVRMNDAYAFLHNRVHEAAYALIPDDARAAAHWRIGRRLVSALTDSRSSMS
jgi:predicted ATPase